jgi:hypothetical protein
MPGGLAVRFSNSAIRNLKADVRCHMPGGLAVHFSNSAIRNLKADVRCHMPEGLASCSACAACAALIRSSWALFAALLLMYSMNESRS